MSALSLFERESGPVLEDFPDDAPGVPAGAEVWVCPVDLNPPPVDEDDPEAVLQAVLEEIRALKPWHGLGREKRGRTTVGTSGMDLETAARYAASFLDGRPGENPRPDIDPANALKLAIEDLRAYCFESAVSQPGSASSRDVFEWFWDRTATGRLHLALDRALAESEDQTLRFLAERQIIPRAQRDRMSEEERAAYAARVNNATR